jgi:hypothetical protein
MNSPRMSGAVNQEQTGSNRSYDYLNPAWAATLTIVTKSQKAVTLLQVTLGGNLTINVGVGSATTDPQIGDELIMIFKSDASIRTITWGTGLLPSATTIATVASKSVTATFMFDGAGWLQRSQSIQA